MFSPGSQLAQLRPSASASTAFTATLRTEVTRILIANTTGAGSTFSIFHDDDGEVYDADTALFFETAINANQTVEVVAETLGSGIMMARGGSIGVKAGADQAVTFTLYGVTEEVT